MLQKKINRGYYTVARRYEFYVERQEQFIALATRT